MLTGLLAGGPLIGLAVAVWLAWGHGLDATDAVLAVIFYIGTGFGVTVGFHRLITHRSFTARPWLRITLAVAGSMSFQGDVIDWVAIHRRHHAFTDRPGDPHSPYQYGTTVLAQLHGLGHAHLGWMFHHDPTSAAHYAPDLLADPAMARVARAFPALCAASLLLPAAAGWAIGGDLSSAFTAFLWAGLVRVLVLQHVTWSINSLCHMIGTRPHPSRRFDRSTDLWPLALISFGESWHNGHHSAPLLRPPRPRPPPDRPLRHPHPPVRTPALGQQRPRDRNRTRHPPVVVAGPGLTVTTPTQNQDSTDTERTCHAAHIPRRHPTPFHRRHSGRASDAVQPRPGRGCGHHRPQPHSPGRRLVAILSRRRHRIAALVTALAGRLGRIVRVAVDKADFDNIPHKIAIDGRMIRIGWFDNLHHQVIVTRGRQDQFLLAVIPPQTPRGAAQAGLAAASAGPGGPPAHQIFTRYAQQFPQTTGPTATTSTNSNVEPRLDQWADDGAPAGIALLTGA